MKKKTISIISVFLLIAVFVGLIFLGIEIFRPKRTTTIGEIVYITQLGQEYGEEFDEVFTFFVYVKPLGKTENDDWILFTVDNYTETESEKKFDITKMPELTVGATVEIVHNVDINRPNVKNHYWIVGYFAESLKVYNGDTASLEGQEIPLKLNKKYNFDIENVEYGLVNSGEIVGIIKVDAPINGYIIYIHHDSGLSPQYILGKYWVEEETMMDDELRAMIESGTTGARIYEGAKTEHYPFVKENKDVAALFRLFYALGKK